QSLLSGGDGLRLWDVTTGKLKRRLDVASTWGFALDLSARRLAMAGAPVARGGGTVQILDLPGWKVKRTVEARKHPPAWLPFSPGGRRPATPRERAIIACDPADGREILRIPVPAGGTRSVAFTPDGKAVAVCDGTDTVRLRDTSNGRTIR